MYSWNQWNGDQRNGKNLASVNVRCNRFQGSSIVLAFWRDGSRGTNLLYASFCARNCYWKSQPKDILQQLDSMAPANEWRRFLSTRRCFFTLLQLSDIKFEQNVPKGWTRRWKPLFWPPRNLNLTPYDFFSPANIPSMIYSTLIDSTEKL